jgi:hypothetical protein
MPLKIKTLTISYFLIFFLGLNELAFSQHFTTANNKMNVLFIGVDNPISVTVEGYSSNDIDIAMDSAIIVSLGGGSYNIIPKLAGLQSLRIFGNKVGERKIIGEYKFRVKYLPDPIARIGGKNCWGCNPFKANLGMVAALDNFDFDARFVIDSFTVTILNKKTNTIVFSAKNIGANFSPQVKSAFGKAYPGDKVYFDDIYVHGPDNRERHINSVTITLL